MPMTGSLMAPLVDGAHHRLGGTPDASILAVLAWRSGGQETYSPRAEQAAAPLDGTQGASTQLSHLCTQWALIRFPFHRRDDDRARHPSRTDWPLPSAEA